MYDVTIAIPLYNAEQYIQQTMNSALEQTFQNIEYLLIDDCGTDNSLNIIHVLQNEHKRGKDIKIINHKYNRGVAETRNTAIREASGKYLFFLDSDDLITPDCIERLFIAAERNNAELAIASHRQIYQETGREVIFQLPDMTSNKPDILASLRFGQLHHLLGFFIWNILYKMSFIHDNKLEFQNIHIGEDFIFMYDALPLVKSFVLLKDITYTYIRRPNSLSQHGKRTIIPLSEIQEQMAIRSYGKMKFMQLKDKLYMEDMITNIMKYSFEAASYIVNSRKIITPPVPSSELSKLLHHPLTINEIMKLKKHKISNLAYFFFEKLPPKLSVYLLICFLYMLRLSWRLKSWKQK